MTNEELNAIEERANRATPGPWVRDAAVVLRDVGRRILLASCALPAEYTRPVEQCISDAAFIAHAREDIPALVARVKELGDALANIVMLTGCECKEISPVMCAHHVAQHALEGLGRWPIPFPTESDKPSDTAKTAGRQAP